jgi:hypothetical protein
MEEMYSKFQNFGTTYEESNNLQVREALIIFSTKNGLNSFINKVSNNNEPVLMLRVCAFKQIDTNANWLYIVA